MPITVDLSGLFGNHFTRTKNVKEHLAFLESEGLGDYEAITFQQCSSNSHIAALKALIPMKGRSTSLTEVIFPYPERQWDFPNSINPEGGNLDIACLHFRGEEYFNETSLPHIDLVGFLESLISLNHNITIQEIVVEISVEARIKLSEIVPRYLKTKCGGSQDVPSSVHVREGLGKTLLVLSSGSDQHRFRMGVSEQNDLQISPLLGGPQYIMPHLSYRSISPDNAVADSHSTFVSVTDRGLNVTPNEYELENLKLEQIHDNGSKGKGVAVAVLSSGCNIDIGIPFQSDHCYTGIPDLSQNVVGKMNFINQYNPVHESDYQTTMSIGTRLSLAVVDMAPESKLVVCKTTFGKDGGYKAPSGATAKAITWLRKKWSGEGWKEEHGLHSLVVLIPYGGHYREDEMIAINEAIDDGIIVVCAAGNTFAQQAGIAFPASMGNVLCVGESDQGGRPVLSSPSGREIDCLAPNQVLPNKSRKYFDHCILHGTGASASVLVGFLSLLLSYIHTALKANPPRNTHIAIIREILKHTTRSGKHNSHAGYGMVMPYVFSFSEHQLRRLLTWKIRNPKFEWEKDDEQGDYNIKALPRLVSELAHKGEGEGVNVVLIDTECKIKEVQIDSVYERASDLRKRIENIKNVKKFDVPHGLRCAMVFEKVAPNANLSLCSYLDPSRQDASDQIAAKIEEVAKEPNPPHIISCSLGPDHFNLGLAVAVNKAINAGIIPIFPVGNEGLTSSNAICYPSRLGNVLCIGAHTSHGAYHIASSVGREVDFLAAGEIVFSDDYHKFGTSFAVPIVAGFVALILGYLQDIVKGNLKNPEGEPIDNKYKSINCWSKSDQSGEYEWRDIPIDEACRNVYVIRALLRQMSVYRTEHSDTAGYGNLDIRRLLNDLAPEDIHDIVQNFYKSQ